ncbi:PKD domain-containing protein, partial [Candidatus Bipolaricaulota bacterium]|nr:PKD domain-containing protein [Candidatus Bipolaricaulota bacterium]
VFALTGCGFFSSVPTPVITTDPPLDNNNTVSANVGDTIEFSGENSTDPNNNIDSYSWNFGTDTHFIQGGSAVETASGEVQTGSYDATGTYTVSLTVTDADGHSDSINVTADIS